MSQANECRRLDSFAFEAPQENFHSASLLRQPSSFPDCVVTHPTLNLDGTRRNNRMNFQEELAQLLMILRERGEFLGDI